MTARTSTKQRLVAAASALFAERGFYGTTIREIAERAGVNLAAGHYHYGSKRDLYLEVLRAEFAAIRAELARRGTVRTPTELDRLSADELTELLRRRSKVMVDVLLGTPPSVHATLMQREMTDPSEALPVIVREFILPTLREMEQIVARLAPGLGADEVERCVFSIMGQALFYRFCRPAVLKIWGRRSYPPGVVAELARHIDEFSLGGIVRLAAAADARPRRRARAR